MLRTDPASSATTPARALIDGQLIMLTRLAEIGMEIAEAAGRAATLAQPAAGAVLNDPALVYSRAARAVRMTIALQSQLLKDLAALDKADDLDAAGRAATRRYRAHRLIERALEAGREGDEGEIEQLTNEAHERLSDWDDADIAGRSLAEVVTAICRDLGLPAEETAWSVSQITEREGEAQFTAEPHSSGPGPLCAGPPPTRVASTRPGARSRASPGVVAI